MTYLNLEIEEENAYYWIKATMYFSDRTMSFVGTNCSRYIYLEVVLINSRLAVRLKCMCSTKSMKHLRPGMIKEEVSSYF